MQGLTIKAQCTVFHNDLQINCLKKSKLSAISLDKKNKLLVITGKGDNQIFRFPIQKLKSIHKKFIEEGKITIQFDSQVKGIVQKGLQNINQNIHSGGNNRIFISNACKQNLQALVNQLVSLRKQSLIASQHAQTNEQQRKTIQQKPKNKKIMPQPIKDEINQGICQKLGRKYLFGLSKNENNKQKPQHNSKREILKERKVQITILDLPQILLRQIFAISGITLSQRLISKQIEQLILKNITNIKLKQEVQEESFNKLAKWAINIEAKPKYVKTLKLQDKNDEQILLKNKAKTLKFGNWKQISSKHISQLKGLRIYCLEIPYSIKFQFSNLFGLRLVELRLKGKGVNVKNSMIKDEDLLYMVNNIPDLRVLEVAYASTKLLSQIKNPQKMQQIRIGMINKIGTQEWTNFQRFKNLQILSIQDCQKNGCAEKQQNAVYDASFPETLKQLEMGFNISRLSRSMIPQTLKHLRLLGTHFKNNDIDDMFLPGLVDLDIAYCPNLTPSCLQNIANLKVFTNWDRNTVQYANNYYKLSNISISSVRGFSSY